jgi:predicted PurR-regulated permease PerM
MFDKRLAGQSGFRPELQAAAPRVANIMTIFVLIVGTLYFGREVLMPVMLALLLAFVLAPLVNLLRRVHLGHVSSVLLGVTLALCVMLVIGGVIGSQVAQLTMSLPQYATTVEIKVANVKDFAFGRLAELADKVGTQGGKGGTLSRLEAGQPNARNTSSPPAPKASGSSPLKLAERYLSPVLSPFATFGIVFIVAVFALLQKEDLLSMAV